ncbi:MAG: hypothetical protein KC543_05890, partial [Myxococcales bacterium]|nr:hypothetical protein [Myxococcales bacterium]
SPDGGAPDAGAEVSPDGGAPDAGIDVSPDGGTPDGGVADGGVDALPPQPPALTDRLIGEGCVDIPTEPVVGGDCVRDADCDGGDVCRRRASPVVYDDLPVALRCGPRSVGAAPGERCAVGADCDRGLCVVAGTCVAACAADADCGAAARCRPVHVKPDSSTTEITYACIPRFTLPPDIEVETHADVPMTWNDPGTADDGRWATASIDLPGGEGLYIAEPGCDTGAQVILLATRDTPSALFYDQYAVNQDVAGASVNPAGTYGVPTTMLIPNGPVPVPSSAGYTAGFWTHRREPVRLDVLRGVRDGGVLNLDIFYVGAESLAPVAGTPPPQVAAALEDFAGLVRGAGITLGEVRHHEVSGILAMRMSRLSLADGTDDSYPKLPELLSLSAGVPSPSLSLFLVETIDDLWGQAGAVTGPLGANGLAVSGVAIGVAGPLSTRHGLGHTMAHELGHFLGLFHTTERDGRVFEALPDTLVCPRSRDANRDGLLTWNECGGAGADNVMFWQVDYPATFSGDQLDVLSRSLILTKP